MDSKPNVPKPAPGEAWREKPVMPKQRVLLEFLKLPVPPTRGGASNLIQSVFESPAGNAHQNAWEAAKYDLHPTLYPPEPPAALAKRRSFTPVRLLLKMALAFGLGFYAWQWFEWNSGSSDAGDTPTFPMPEPGQAATGNPPASDRSLISLQSTDGRTISARILTLTKTTVLIRRADGQTFELPLERLTPDSKQRIDEYRAARRAGLIK